MQGIRYFAGALGPPGSMRRCWYDSHGAGAGRFERGWSRRTVTELKASANGRAEKRLKVSVAVGVKQPPRKQHREWVKTQ